MLRQVFGLLACAATLDPCGTLDPGDPAPAPKTSAAPPPVVSGTINAPSAVSGSLPAVRPAATCQACTYNGSCKILQDGTSKLPCCMPITTMLGQPNPTEVAKCEKIQRETPPVTGCKTCLATKGGKSCMRLEAMGNADPRPCCEKNVPVGVPVCD